MNHADIEARIVFKSDEIRHAFMMKAIDKEDFAYLFAGDGSVILSQKNADRLATLAKKFGGTAMPMDKPSKPTQSDLPDREERAKAWNALAEEIRSLKIP